MMPVIFRIPFVNLEIPGYGLMLMLGFLLSVIWAVHRTTRSGGNPDTILNCAFIALIGGVLGARLMFVFHYWDLFAHVGSWVSVLLAIIDVRKGGLEVYGGVIASILGVLIYLVVWRHSVRWYFDILAPSCVLGMGLGRLGCFLNGCCWGVTCDLPWSVRFPFGSGAEVEQWYAGEPGSELPKELIFCPPNGITFDGRSAYPLMREMLRFRQNDVEQAQARFAQARALGLKRTQAKTDAERQQIEREINQLGPVGAANQYAQVIGQMDAHHLTFAELQALARRYQSLPVHPTQLYSTIMLCLLALLLNAVYWRRTRDGQVICTMLLIEPWTRYTLELLRADNPVDVGGRFTISQLLAIVLSAIGLIGFFLLRYLPPRSPRAKLWVPAELPAPAGKKKTGAGARA